MSCDSITGSVATSRPVFGSAPNPSWFWRFPFALLDRVSRRRQYNELLELDERLLRDVGLSRAIVAEARQSAGVPPPDISCPSVKRAAPFRSGALAVPRIRRPAPTRAKC
ncbi:DUF1127 domain-containing protein [Bradyrhizobium liaoningense]|uniref:DUF1127 domain-containing protein n=1 Tax=Bradyrhizobium liaoningense TaxID=43992 RepID=UPI001BA8918C|nr:DUF1127 domain-containing protein [Bradyrhizobium liaoningense]MBR0905737.1 DUF1127 domain-containing protein [Bradyrhizobium liaoningense]